MKPLWYPRSVWLRLAMICAAGLLLLTSCELPWKKSGTTTPTPEETTVAGEVASTQAGGEMQTPTDGAPVETPSDFVELTANDFTGSADALNGLILFSSTSGDPFESLDIGVVNMPAQESYLWAISPDGKRGGRISPEDHGSAVFFSASKLDEKPRIIDYGIQLAGDKVDLVSAPDDCADQNCGGFQFSRDGRFLAYFIGAADTCGRDLKLMEIRTRKIFHTWTGAHAAYFLNDGSLVVLIGGCEQQVAYLYIPNTDHQEGIGAGSVLSWNPSRQAMLWQTVAQPHKQPALWGLNLDSSRVFLWTTTDPVVEDSPAWTPDGRHFLFQHRSFSYDEKNGDVVLTGARQIIVMDAWTRDQKLLAMDGKYDYHLCQSAGEPCDQWSGDWIQVRRTPFKATRIRIEDRASEASRCALYGLDCAESGELYGLNWKTGELLPWADTGAGDPVTLPDATPPDLKTTPVYEDPAGAFAFYTSTDGHHLWYVPQGGDPVLWVKDGQGFVYIP